MTTTPDTAPGTTHRPEAPQRSEGPAAAALLAAGIGAFTLGLLTTLAEASTDIREALTFSDDVGPLSGKTIIAVAVWLVAWLVLQLTAARRLALTRGVLIAFAILLALGVLGTFPTFFEAFAPE
ncbi:MAG TPA: hypothetical protein VFR67_12400 [Pilimelia sp.]|nr:hypothetical protein [Pilimelia sp.]